MRSMQRFAMMRWRGTTVKVSIHTGQADAAAVG